MKQNQRIQRLFPPKMAGQLLLAVLVTAVALCPPGAVGQTPQPYQWKNATILGGGFVSGIVFSPTEKDLVYARTDVGGAYRRNTATAAWIPLTDFLSAAQENYSGILSIATDPGAPTARYIWAPAAGALSTATPAPAM